MLSGQWGVCLGFATFGVVMERPPLTGEGHTRAGRLRTNESPGKEDENRGFAWGKRYVEQRATPPAE